MPVRLSTGLVDEIATHLASTLMQGYLYLYDGTQPTSSDDSATGYTKLAEITVDGQTGMGLEMSLDANGVIKKPDSATWQGLALADGTVGWGRFYDMSVDEGASTTGNRIDFNAATSGAPLTMANTTVTTGAVVTIDTCTMTMPKE